VGIGLTTNDLDNRGQKSVEVSSTYIQVLIGLALGIIAALIGLYPTLLGIKHFDFTLMKVALGCLGFSIVGGLIGLGTLIVAISKTQNDIPPSKVEVNIPVIFQFVLFAVGILLMLVVLPIPR
jgi:uncharacterized membrane protein